MNDEPKPRYRWPWLVLVLVLLGVLLALLWMRVAVNRVRQYRSGTSTHERTPAFDSAKGSAAARTDQTTRIPDERFQ